VGKKSTLILVFSSLVLLLVVLPVVIFGPDKIEIWYVAVEAVATLVAAVIAILFYEKFGIGRKIIDKQSDVVLGLAEELKKIRIDFTIGKSINNTGATIFYKPCQRFWYSLNEFDRAKLGFSNKYLVEIGEIAKLGESIYMPSEIKQRMQVLSYTALAHLSETDMNDYMIARKPIAKSKEDEFIGIPIPTGITFLTYKNNWKDLIEAIHNWIKSNAESEIDFNLWEGEVEIFGPFFG